MKRTWMILVLLFLSFSIYVAVATRNSKQMTTRQKILKAFYPALMWFRNKTSPHEQVLTNKDASPKSSFYELSAQSISGQPFPFSSLRGKKVLLVNTASDCGYTGQYAELEKLYEQEKDRLVIIGFPSNDFKDQERGSDEEIEKFCKVNFGVSFPLMKKSTVRRSGTQHEVFQWLADANRNGWNDQQPVWNFSKYLVDEKGNLRNYFGPSVSPVDKLVLDAIRQ